MLKIKDNIDLKKLENFGFKEHPENYFGSIYTNYENSTISSIDILADRKLIIDTDYGKIDEQLDILYNLIKADMVEMCDNQFLVETFEEAQAKLDEIRRK